MKMGVYESKWPHRLAFVARVGQLSCASVSRMSVVWGVNWRDSGTAIISLVSGLKAMLRTLKVGMCSP
jgi:hypothetical protein